MPPVDERAQALQLIPSIKEGASRFGIHFIGSWVSCPRKAALELLMPHPEGGVGLAPNFTKRPLGVGWTYHEGIAAWYQSRCVDRSTGSLMGDDCGQPSLEYALNHIDVAAASRKAEWEDEEEWAADVALCKELVTRYDQWYGPRGVDPEWPNVRVFVDASGPWIERTIEVPIGTTGLIYTCRPDLLATHLGTMCVWEHKTTSPSSMSGLLARMHVEAQPTGELRALRHAHPDLARHVSAVTINVINKKPAKTGRGTTPHFARERVTRTEDDFQQFDYDVESTLLWIGGMILRWVELQEAPHRMDPWEAMRWAFPKLGTMHGACHAYNTQCHFAQVCQQTGREERMALSFRPRVPLTTQGAA